MEIEISFSYQGSPEAHLASSDCFGRGCRKLLEAAALSYKVNRG